MPFFSRYSASEQSARQLLTTGDSSRITNPDACGRHDSMSHRVDAVVPDQRIRHRHDLPFIRGIRQDFLYPVIEVLKQTSPLAEARAPNLYRGKTEPSSRAKMAFINSC